MSLHKERAVDQTQSSTSASTRKSPPKTSRNTLYGSTAYERESQQALHYGREAGPSRQPIVQGKTEYDILKENHRFIREDEEPKNVSWEERVARAYESKLFKEYALIDLKHYKSKKIALRWRSAEEVVNGIGEETCSSLRCPSHYDPTDQDFRNGIQVPPLRAFELPFAYKEAGERKSALVKVKLCGRCERKLMYKPDKDGMEEGEKDIGKDSESRGRAKRGSRERETSPRRGHGQVGRDHGYD